MQSATHAAAETGPNGLWGTEAGRYGDVLSLIILIDGAPIVESYFNGHEWDQRAPLYSVTKSVLSALFGIAIAEGHIASVDERVLDYFPEYDPVANFDERKRAMTVGHLLAMTAGLHWDELSLPYDDPNNHYQRYLKSDDRIEYALGLPMDHRPGVQVTYNTALSQILSAILSRATGHSAAGLCRGKAVRLPRHRRLALDGLRPHNQRRRRRPLPAAH